MKFTFADVIKKSFDAYMKNIYTFMPGVIDTYNPTLKKASVKPSIKKQIGNQTISYPIITDVPVVFAGGKESGTFFPLTQGDRVMLFFSCESLENFLLSAENEVEPGDGRKFSLTDCVCLPGLYNFVDIGKTGGTTGLESIFKTYKVTIDDTGITLNSNDASQWKPNILALDPFTGLPHGGAGAGIIKLRGA